MPDIETLNHTKWDCKYHVVFIPKYRRKALYHELRRHLGEVFRALAAQKECRIEEGHLMADHVHMLLSIPPKYSVAQVVGFIKGKAAIHIARTFMGRRKNSTGHHFWARGYYVSTVGRDEAVIRENWLQVFCRAEASRMGHGGRQPLHTRAVRSEKCVLLRGRVWTGMRVIAVFFGPCTPYVLIAHISGFSHYFKRLDRFTKLATSSGGSYAPQRLGEHRGPDGGGVRRGRITPSGVLLSGCAAVPRRSDR